MKFTLSLNQVRALEMNISLQQALILDLVYGFSSWAKTILIGDVVYYWVTKEKICSELPILKLKEDTAYRHLKGLRDQGLIEYVKKGQKDLFKLTQKGESYFSNCSTSELGNKSEFRETSKNDGQKLGNKSEFGNKSEKTRKNIRENSEINPRHFINYNQDPERETRANPKTLIDPCFTPDEATLFQLEKNKLKPLNATELQSFICYYQGEGSLKANWQAVYRKWVVNERKNYGKQSKSKFQPQAPINTGPQSNFSNDHLTRPRSDEEDKQSQAKLKNMLDAIQKRKGDDSEGAPA